MFEAMGAALSGIFQPWPLFLMLTGVVCGSIFATLPGIGSLVLIAIVLPFAVTLDPYAAIALLLGIGAVANTANTFPSVLIAVPGSAGSQATIVDGLAAEAGEIEALHPLPDGPWIFRRAALSTSPARVVTDMSAPCPRERPALFGLPATLRWGWP